MTTGRGTGKSVRDKWTGAREEKGGLEVCEGGGSERVRERGVHRGDCDRAGSWGREVRGGTRQMEAGFGGVTEKWAEVLCGGEWKIAGVAARCEEGMSSASWGRPVQCWRWSVEPVGAGNLHEEGEGHGGEPRGAMCYFSDFSLAPASRSTALECLSPPRVHYPFCHLLELISCKPLE